MINRRHIRLKIMQYLYASEISNFEYTKEHYKNLINNIHSIHNLYLLQISFLIEIWRKAQNKYKISRVSISGIISKKYTNTKFSDNEFLNQISKFSKFSKLINSKSFINWEVDYNYVNLIYDKIIDSEIYRLYIDDSNKSFEKVKIYTRYLKAQNYR